MFNIPGEIEEQVKKVKLKDELGRRTYAVLSQLKENKI